MFYKIKEVLILLLSATLPAVLSISSFSGLARSAEPNSIEKKYGGTLRIGHCSPPTPINPILTENSASMSVMSLVFSRLVQYDSEGKIQPDLVKYWEISKDKRTYTFYIREGVKFHDGHELTAADVFYTYQAIRDSKNTSPYCRTLELVDYFSVKDEYTFEVHLKSPNISFIHAMVREIAPQHLYKTDDIRTAKFNYKPVGTGPFKFKKWSTDNSLEIEANAEYFSGRPYLDSVVYKTYSSPSEVWSGFMRGEIDLVEFLDVNNYKIVKNDKAFTAYEVATSHYYLIYYNPADPIMNDINVRLAIAHSINRKNLIQYIENGYGIEAVGPFSQKSWAYNSDVDALNWNPELSVRLLNSAGWRRSGSDGIMDKNGKKLILRALVDKKNEKLKKIALFVRQNLQEIGIKLEVNLYDGDASENQFKLMESYQAVFAFFPGSGYDPNEIIKLWGSLDLRVKREWFFFSADPELDQLIRLGAETYNFESRVSIYREIHKRIYNQQPACFLYFPYDFHAVSNRFSEVDQFLGCPDMPDHQIKNIYQISENVSSNKSFLKGGD